MNISETDVSQHSLQSCVELRLPIMNRPINEHIWNRCITAFVTKLCRNPPSNNESPNQWTYLKQTYWSQHSLQSCVELRIPIINRPINEHIWNRRITAFVTKLCRTPPSNNKIVQSRNIYETNVSQRSLQSCVELRLAMINPRWDPEG